MSVLKTTKTPPEILQKKFWSFYKVLKNRQKDVFITTVTTSVNEEVDWPEWTSFVKVRPLDTDKQSWVDWTVGQDDLVCPDRDQGSHRRWADTVLLDGEENCQTSSVGLSASQTSDVSGITLNLERTFSFTTVRLKYGYSLTYINLHT